MRLTDEAPHSLAGDFLADPPKTDASAAPAERISEVVTVLSPSKPFRGARIRSARWRGDVGFVVFAAAVAIVIIGGAIRAVGIGSSIWFDEAVSVKDVSGSFGQMLHAVINHEASPPFYFICLWIWRHLFGSAAVDLRGLSLLAGTMTIALAFYVGRRRISPRVGLLLALCVAVSPTLVYYSTEMRMYAVLILLTGISFEAFLCARQSPNTKNLSLWAVASLLALWTQYYAVLAVAPEAALLLAVAWKRGPAARGTFGAVAGVAAGGLPLIYLLPYQARHAFAYGGTLISAPWHPDRFTIQTHSSLRSVVEGLLVGPGGGPTRAILTVLIALIAITATGYGLYRSQVTRRQLLFAGCLLAPAALTVQALIELHLAVSARYLLVLWLPVGLGTVFLLAAADRFGTALTGALAFIWVVLALASIAIPRFAARDDALGAARSLGVASTDRLIAVSQTWDVLPLEEYRPQAVGETARVVHVRELDVVAMPVLGMPQAGEHVAPASAGLAALPRGLRLADVVHGSTYLIDRFIAATPVAIRLDRRGTFLSANYWRFLAEPAGARTGSL